MTEGIERLAEELADERDLMSFDDFEGAFCGDCPMQSEEPYEDEGYMIKCGVAPWQEECPRRERWRGIEAAFTRARVAIVEGLERESEADEKRLRESVAATIEDLDVLQKMFAGRTHMIRTHLAALEDALGMPPRRR